MYEFVDTIESPKNKGLMSIQTIFNDVNLDDELTDDNGSFTTLTVSGRSNVVQRIQPIPVPGLDGEVEQNNPTIGVREPVIKFRLRDKTNEGFRDRLTRLIELLKGSKRKMKFTDEDVVYYATLSELDIPDEESNDLICNLMMYCSDPYKYGPKKILTFPADIVEITNDGSAEADPIFELTAKKKATFAMVSTGDDEENEYNLIGEPADDDVEKVDTKALIFTQNTSMDSWIYDGVNIDPQVGAVSKGTMTHDGTGIIVNDYGQIPSDTYGYGPAIIRELPESLQDFEIETIIDTKTDNLSDNFRVEIYGLDANMNILGKIGIKDSSGSLNERIGLARVGQYVDSQTRYMIGKNNFRFINSGSSLTFFIKWSREGNIFEFNIYRVVNGELENWVRRRFRDVSNNWQGELKYIQVYIRTYRDRANPSIARVNRLDIYKLSQATVDQTPYILYPGDKVTFDHRDEEVLVNGEFRPEYMGVGMLGSSFFKLRKGKNILAVTPEDTFDAKAIYSNKYL